MENDSMLCTRIMKNCSTKGLEDTDMKIEHIGWKRIETSIFLKLKSNIVCSLNNKADLRKKEKSCVKYIIWKAHYYRNRERVHSTVQFSTNKLVVNQTTICTIKVLAAL